MFYVLVEFNARYFIANVDGRCAERMFDHGLHGLLNTTYSAVFGSFALLNLN